MPLNISSIDLFRIGLTLVVLPFAWVFAYSVRVGLTKMFGSPRIVRARVVGVAWVETGQDREESVLFKTSDEKIDRMTGDDWEPVAAGTIYDFGDNIWVAINEDEWWIVHPDDRYN